MERVITQSFGIAGALVHGSVLLASKRAYKVFSLSGRLAGQLTAAFLFVIHDSSQALPHRTSVRAGVVGFNLSPVLTLCLFHGSSEVVAGFPISVRISVPLLENSSCSL